MQSQTETCNTPAARQTESRFNLFSLPKKLLQEPQPGNKAKAGTDSMNYMTNIGCNPILFLWPIENQWEPPQASELIHVFNQSAENSAWSVAAAVIRLLICRTLLSQIIFSCNISRLPSELGDGLMIMHSSCSLSRTAIMLLLLNDSRELVLAAWFHFSIIIALAETDTHASTARAKLKPRH